MELSFEDPGPSPALKPVGDVVALSAANGGDPSEAAGGMAVDPRHHDGLARRRLFGLELVDAADVETVASAVLAHGAHRRSLDADPRVLPVVVTPNVDILVALDGAPNSLAAEVFRQAQYVLPDGMPIVAASKLLGHPLAARLPGSGLFEVLWPQLVAEKRPLVMLCSNQEIADRLGAEHPNADFYVSPVIDVDNDEQIAVVAKELFELATKRNAQYVLVGLGHPKDSLLIAQMSRLWRENDTTAPLSLGLGGSFAMYVGQKRRAPAWLQRVGLEWFYRFLQEPRRLFRRYFVEDVAFLGIVFRERRALRQT